MRKLDGRAVAEHLRGGGHRLRISAKSGEQICVDLSPDAAAALRDQLAPAPPAAQREPETASEPERASAAASVPESESESDPPLRPHTRRRRR